VPTRGPRQARPPGATDHEQTEQDEHPALARPYEYDRALLRSGEPQRRDRASAGRAQTRSEPPVPGLATSGQLKTPDAPLIARETPFCVPESVDRARHGAGGCRVATRPKRNGVRGIVVVVAALEIILAAVGAIALLFGASLAVWRASMLLRWRKRTATVIGYLRQRAYRGSSFRRLTVCLSTDRGDTIEANDEGIWNRYSEGQVLTVLLVPESDPLGVIVPEFLRFWMMSLIFIPFVAAFLYVALVYVPSLPQP
jgi:hypothetical protein